MIRSGVDLNVEVALMGFVADVAPSRHVSLELPLGATVRDALAALVGLQGEALHRRLLSSAGALQPGVLVTAAGERVGDIDAPLPPAPSVPVQIIVLQAAAGG